MKHLAELYEQALKDYDKELIKNQELEQQCKKQKEVCNKKETQQKEFILYLRNLSNWYSADGVKQGMVNDILQKYKEIIGDDEK